MESVWEASWCGCKNQKRGLLQWISDRSIWIHFLINTVTSKCSGENRWPTGFPVPSSTTTRWLPPGYCYSIIILYWMSVLMLGLYSRGIIALSTKADLQNVFSFLCGGREIAGGKETIKNWLLFLFLYNFDKRYKLLLLLRKQLVKWIFQNMGPIHFILMFCSSYLSCSSLFLISVLGLLL